MELNKINIFLFSALALVAHAKNPIMYSIEAGNEYDEFQIDYQTGNNSFHPSLLVCSLYYLSYVQTVL